MARIVFMGTPEFAVPVLTALAAAHRVVGVVTQPDRPAGRGGARAVPAPPAARVAAQALGIPVYQPSSLRHPEAVETIGAWQPEAIVVAAFGQILRPAVLALPPHGCLNVHASLLPRYRGAAPIPAAILNGEPVTGVTMMVMDEGLDTGPILAQAELPLAGDETTRTLTASLAQLGAGLAVETLPKWLASQIEPRPQDGSQATWCRPLVKDDGLLDWSKPAEQLDRQVRACDPWPGAYTFLGGERLRILRARPVPDRPAAGPPGQVGMVGGMPAVVTGQGLLKLLELQLAGKKPMPADVFVRGRRDFACARLG